MPLEEDPPAARTEVELLIQALDLIDKGPKTIGGMVGPTSIHTCSDGLL